MKLTAELKKQIKDIAEKYKYDYTTCMVRIQDVPFELGEMSHISHVWVDGTDTGDELDGVCGISLDSIDYINTIYFGDHIALLSGTDYTYGEDVGEVIMADAVVLEIIA